MVFFRCGPDGDRWARRLAENGVLLSHLGQGWLRAVTHLHLDDAAVARAADVIVATLKRS
jgi:hypothetical protein